MTETEREAITLLLSEAADEVRAAASLLRDAGATDEATTAEDLEASIDMLYSEVEGIETEEGEEDETEEGEEDETEEGETEEDEEE